MHYDKVDELASTMLRSTNYNQDQWSHPCGAGACLAGNAVFQFGLAPNEIIASGEVRLKRDGFDAAVAQFWAEHHGVHALWTPYQGDAPSEGHTLSDMMTRLSTPVQSVSDRAADLLGVNYDWLEFTKVFYPQPNKHWPEPYATAWASTMGMTNPSQTVLQRSLAVAYLLTLKAIDMEVESLYDAEENESEREKLGIRIEEHEDVLSEFDGHSSVYETIRNGLEALNTEARLLRGRWKAIMQEVTDRHIGNLSTEDILAMNRRPSVSA